MLEKIRMHAALSMGRGLIKLYQNVLCRRPYLVQAVQTGTLMAAGDAISQTFIENTAIKDVDYKRMFKFASIGFFIGVSTYLVLRIAYIS